MPSALSDMSDAPYPGLRAFDERTARWFFGRDALVEALLVRLEREGVLLVTGPSGSGKSSVVRAGLIPRLTADGWQVATLRPGSTPASALAEALAAYPGAQVALLIDQFEELFTQAWSNLPERDRFIAALADLITQRHRLILTLRSDFEGWLDQLPDPLPDLLANRARHHVPPMTARQIAEAIETPASRLGFGFAGSWQEDLKPAALGAGRLPMAQFALQQAWAARDEASATLPRPAFLQEADPADPLADPLAALLATAADAALATCDAVAARTLFLHLVEVSPAGIASDTKRKVRLASLTDLERSVVDALAAEGVWLLTTDAGASGPTVEIAHEALIRCWPTLHGWLEPVRALHLWQARCHAGRARDGDFPRRVWSEADVAEAEIMLAMPDCDPEAARYARQVLAYTQAASLWPMASSDENAGAGWNAIASANPILRSALLDQIVDPDLSQFRPESACSYSLEYLVRALFGVSDLRRTGVSARMGIADWAAIGRERARFWVRLLLQLDLHRTPSPMPAEFAFQAIRVGFRVRHDGDSTQDLSDALQAVAPQLLDKEERFEALFAEFLETTNRDHRFELSEPLIALAHVVAGPDQRYSTLRERLLTTRDRDQVSCICLIQAAFAERIAEPDHHIAVVIADMGARRSWNILDALSRSLIALAARVTEPNRWAAVLLKARSKTRNEGLRQLFDGALSVLAPQVTDSELRFHALRAALLTDHYLVDAELLGPMLVEIAPAMPQPDTLFDAVINDLTVYVSRGAASAFGGVLAELAPRIRDPERRIAQLQATQNARASWRETQVLEGAIAALAVRLTDPARVLDTLYQAFQFLDRAQWPPTAWDALVSAARAIDDPDRRYKRLEKIVFAEEGRHHLDALAAMFGALAPVVAAPDRKFDTLLAAVRGPLEWDQRYLIGVILGALAPRVAEPDQRFDDLVEELPHSQHPAALADALAGFAAIVSDPGRRIQDLLALLRCITDRDLASRLSSLLTALASRIDQANDLFAQLLDLLLSGTAPVQSFAIGQALAALASQVDTPTELLAEVKAAFATPREIKSTHALCTALRSLALQLPENEAKLDRASTAARFSWQARTSEQAEIFEILLDFAVPIPLWMIAAGLTRWASLSDERGYRSYPGYADPAGFDRDELSLLAEATGLPEDASVWAIIAWLKERRPDVNLEAAWGEPILPELAIATPAPLG